MSKPLFTNGFIVVLAICFTALVGCGGEEDGASASTQENGPPSLESVVAHFRKAWNSNSGTDLEATFDPSLVGEIATNIDKFSTRFGWGLGDLPKIGEGVETGQGSTREVSFPMNQDAIIATLENRKDGWVVVKLTARVTLDLKPIEDVVKDFSKAWNASDFDAVYAFLTPAMFEKKSSFQRLFKKRGWESKLPPIELPTIAKVDEFRYTTTFLIDDAGELQCKWIVEAGRWGLRTLRPPKN